MTLDEFKAWLDGFTERGQLDRDKMMVDFPSPDEWSTISAKLATVEAKHAYPPTNSWPYRPFMPIGQAPLTRDEATQAIRNQNDAAQATSQEWPKVPLQGAALDELHRQTEVQWDKQLRAMVEKEKQLAKDAAELKAHVSKWSDSVRRGCVDALAAQAKNASNIEPPAMNVFIEDGMSYHELMGKKS